MELTCSREVLLGALKIARGAVRARNLRPILKHVKFVAQTGKAILTGTDLEVGIRVEMRGVDVPAPGETLLEADTVFAILSELSEPEIVIHGQNNGWVLRSEASEFEMENSDDPADFPEVPDFPVEKYHEIPAALLSQMIQRTLFAAAVENPRYAVTGVLWELDGSLVRLVATDGRRLAMASGRGFCHGGHTTTGGIHVVPTRAMEVLDRNLADAFDPVGVAFSPASVMMRTDRAVIFSRLVDGRFPPYREVFPKTPVVKVPLIAGRFLRAIRRAVVKGPDEMKVVLLDLDKDRLLVKAHGTSGLRSKSEMALRYDGKPTQIAFIASYLTDLLHHFDAEQEITLELVDGSTVAVFRCGENFSYVVMPVV
jgi:DNA polymerase III subunit beta